MIVQSIRKSKRLKSDELPPIDMSYHPQETPIETSRNEQEAFHEENGIDQDHDIPEGEELSTIIQEQWDSVIRDEVRENAISVMEIEDERDQTNTAIEKGGNEDDSNSDEEFSIDGEKEEFAKLLRQKNKKRIIFLKTMSKYYSKRAMKNKQSEQPSETNPALRQVKKRNHNKFLKEVEVLDTRLRKRNREGQVNATRKMSTRNNIQQITE